MSEYSLTTSTIRSVYVYDPSSGEIPPPFVHARTTMQGAQAIAKPPNGPVFYLSPGDALVELEDDFEFARARATRWCRLDSIALACLLVKSE